MNFSKLTLSDLPTLRPFFEQNECRICDCTIGGVFMWRDYFNTEFVVEDDILYFKVNYFDEGVAFPPPRGEHEGEAFDRLIEHCEKEIIPVRLCAVSVRNLEKILARYPHAKYHTDRAWSDYLYESEAMKTLTGRKLSAQRNHIHRFERENPDWSFERITNENKEAVRDFFRHSFDERRKDSPTYTEGNEKTFEILDNYDLYGFVGGILRVGNEIVGASLGEVLGDTLYVHVERSDVNISGVYQKLTNSFANEFASDGIMFINREEDDGDEGLRKAKLAYHPAEILEKYYVEL